MSSTNKNLFNQVLIGMSIIMINGARSLVGVIMDGNSLMIIQTTKWPKLNKYVAINAFYKISFRLSMMNSVIDSWVPMINLLDLDGSSIWYLSTAISAHFHRISISSIKLYHQIHIHQLLDIYHWVKKKDVMTIYLIIENVNWYVY